MYHYMRPLLESGRVFAAQPPLYTVKVGDDNVHAFSDDEKDQLTAELVKGGRKAENLQWVRFKGLGEMDIEELAVTCLDAETRILRRITMDDAHEATAAADLFETLMGNDVARRRKYLLDNSELVDRDSPRRVTTRHSPSRVTLDTSEAPLLPSPPGTSSAVAGVDGRWPGPLVGRCRAPRTNLS